MICFSIFFFEKRSINIEEDKGTYKMGMGEKIYRSVLAIKPHGQFVPFLAMKPEMLGGDGRRERACGTLGTKVKRDENENEVRRYRVSGVKSRKKRKESQAIERKRAERKKNMGGKNGLFLFPECAVKVSSTKRVTQNCTRTSRRRRKIKIKGGKRENIREFGEKAPGGLMVCDPYQSRKLHPPLAIAC